MNRQRVRPHASVQTDLLVLSKRRCCLCFYVDNLRIERPGQIAHLDGDRTNSTLENLVWLCLEHHDRYDSTTRQSKNFQPGEVRRYRDMLHRDGSLHSHASDPSELAPVPGSESAGRRRGKVSFIDEPWKLGAWSADAGPFLFAYKSPNGLDGVCRVYVQRARSQAKVIILEHTRDNPGLSITNAAEAIVFQVCRALQLELRETTWIEHYEGNREWMLLTFEEVLAAGMPAGPKWQKLTARMWSELGVVRPKPPPRTPPWVPERAPVAPDGASG